jgi:diguanylate cyclase (GGDEF)-like protein
MSLKSEYILRFLVYIILVTSTLLLYINLENQINMILSATIVVLSIGALIAHNRDLKQKMILNSIYDQSTKLYNRQYFIAELNTTYERARRYDSPLSLLLIKVENLEDFKSKQKDIVLREIGKYMLNHARNSDTVSRYSDDTVVVLFPRTDYLHAQIAKDRFQKGLLSLTFNVDKKPIFKFTTIQNSKEEDVDEFLVRVFDLA